MGIFVKQAGAWQEVGVTPTTPIASGGTVTAAGTDRVHTFTANGTLTVTRAGFARVLVLGGGGAAGLNTAGYSGGGGGQCFDGWVYLPVGNVAITIGAAPPATANTQNGVNGNHSEVGSTPPIKAWGGGGGTNGTIWQGPRGGGGNQGGAGAAGSGGGSRGAGLVSDISGANVEYGRGGGAAQAGNESTSGAGRVIIRYPNEG